MDSSRAQGSGPEGGAQGEGALLHDTIQTLNKTIKETEKEFARTVELNEVAEQNLERQRKQTYDVQRANDLLRQRIRDREQDGNTAEPLRDKVRELEAERARLSAAAQALGRQSAEAEQHNRGSRDAVERLTIEVERARVDLDALEAQLERALEIAADVATRSDALLEERDVLAERLSGLEGRLPVASAQRDALRVEVEESRKALDDIRESLAESCAISQRQLR